MGQHWDYLLGQVTNTAHHLILIGYLREKYAIVSHLHLRLLQYHFEKMVRENFEDRESLYAQGLITFEYRKLIGEVDWVIPLNPQGQMIRQSYLAAQRHFDHYHFQTIPSPSSYRNDILSFLEDLGYAKEGFIFFQPRARKRGQNASADGRLSGATSV
jgi:hypothetical protein